MFKSSFMTLSQFSEVLTLLPEGCYNKPCTILSGATIGQHTRHIIELYQCLLNNYPSGKISYDHRKRDKHIEQDIIIAQKALQNVQLTLKKPNKNLEVCYLLNEIEEHFNSNYYREVMYNLEHTIHHKALIKVAINHFTDISLPESFGVAASTMKHRKKCVQ